MSNVISIYTGEPLVAAVPLSRDDAALRRKLDSLKAAQVRRVAEVTRVKSEMDATLARKQLEIDNLEAQLKEKTL